MNPWLRYANEGKIRDKPLSPRLIKALSFLPEMGVEMEVFSGGQDPAGPGARRTGSVRHDSGDAADAFFYQNGKRLDWSNTNDVPILQNIVGRAKERGLTGFGAGRDYMSPGSVHVGFGNEAVWGAGGRSANAPEWLREAASGSAVPSPPVDATQPKPGLLSFMGLDPVKPNDTPLNFGEGSIAERLGNAGMLSELFSAPAQNQQAAPPPAPKRPAPMEFKRRKSQYAQSLMSILSGAGR